MEADDAEAVESRLRAQRLLPTKVKKKGKTLSGFSIGSGVSQKDLVTFTRLLATMIDAGLPIVQCLDILGNQTDNKTFSGIIADIKSQVEQGKTFSESLHRHPAVFDSLYCNLVEAGEKGGIMDNILNRLAVYNEKSVKLKRQLRGAMVYPSVVGVVFLGVCGILLGWVIPSFKNIFKDLGSKDELPKITQIVISASEAFVGNLPLVLLLIAGITVGLVTAYRRPDGRRYIHKTLLRVPIVGDVIRKIAVARFTRTLGTLLSSGVPILDALEIVARTAGNMVIEEAVMYARQKISEGRNMAEPLMEANVFPPMVVQMVGVGEQTGALDAMLNKIADFYEEEVDVAVAALTSLIEPFMMVGIGSVVGTVLIAMYLPIFSLAGKIKSD
ncbi:MAG TPA: type II secretion system F family protein [Polyangiaceae bacterium]|nr:type II secretion system F family protein [Polyangiaceae bacterium]